MKFVMTQAICPEGMALLDGRAEIFVANGQDPNCYLDQMRNADALIVRIAKCDQNAIANSPALKVIGRTGVGYDTVDVAAASARGIPVVITPGANNRSVAEHAVAMMFALAKNLAEAQKELCAGNWEIRNAHKAFELEGKTVGVIGMGAIGRETAKICRGCGMRVKGYDPFMRPEQLEALGVTCCPNIETLLSESDILTVHVPLSKETRDMIARPQLERMKKTALLINCSRGGIVNETDLVEALREGRIAGAGADVYCVEPPRKDDPMLNCPNLIVTPHSAAQTREAVVKMAQMCVKGCLAVCEGKKWPYVADQSVYHHPVWMGREWAEV